MSEWLRDAARQKMNAQESDLESTDDLKRFFRYCDQLEPGGREPDWEDHREAIEQSIRSGSTDT